MPGKWPAIALLSLCEVMAMSLWFAASAVAPQLRALYPLSGGEQAAFASSVALGFVLGTMGSALVGLADRFDQRRTFAVSAVIAAAANAAAAFVDLGAWGMIGARLVVGAAMAGIYPVGMRMAATWAVADTGILVGILVGALTLGSASAFMLAAFGAVDWRATLLATSALALLAAAMIALFRPGPALARSGAFRVAMIWQGWRNPALRLANYGYFGHMWELYAMWAWISVFLTASFGSVLEQRSAAFAANLAAFAAIGAGAIGSLLGGLIADRWGRTTLTTGAMLASGSCAILAGLLFGADPWLLVLLCVVWGVAVIADSAQFSASVIELSDPAVAGSMLTIQTCIGFLLTVVTIQLLPVLADRVGWALAVPALAIGPYLGALAMLRLRAHPDAVRLAGGRR